MGPYMRKREVGRSQSEKEIEVEVSGMSLLKWGHEPKTTGSL